MNTYKLKKWYPSLSSVFENGDIIQYNSNLKIYVRVKSPYHTVNINEVENHPDYWELIEEKKLLFITDDGVEVSNPEDWVYLVNPLFEKIERYARNSNINISKEIVKVFYFEANADDYIWRNKRLFSYEDFNDFNNVGEGMWYNIKEIAKERAGNGK